MKCIHCGTDSKLKDRSDGRCPRCKHEFAFEPTKDTHRVTDGQLKAAIDRLSWESRVMFTERADARWYEAGKRVELATLTPATIQWELQRAFAATAMPGEPARDEVVRRAALTGGAIAATLLPIPSSGDASSTGGFG